MGPWLSGVLTAWTVAIPVDTSLPPLCIKPQSAPHSAISTALCLRRASATRVSSCSNYADTLPLNGVRPLLFLATPASRLHKTLAEA